MQPGNFVSFRPRKSAVRIRFNSLNQPDTWVKQLENSGLEFTVLDGESLRVTVTPKAFEENKPLLTQMLQQAISDYESG